ncbi:MAG: inositol monophosphatase [Candidatus Methylopumilus sp.]|nr:inositol monophosphatase [Candidatus Methylopumilus sp.]
MHPMLNIAVKAARRAGAIINRASQDIGTLTVKSKNFNDFVSEVDVVAERAIIDTLKATYPTHGFLGEESGASSHDSDYIWIIDPLDGTTNFLHSFPQYCVSIALQHKGEITQAVIYEPNRNELYTATKGRGAFLNDKRIRVSKCDKLQESLIGTGFPFRDFKHLDTYMAMFKSMLQKTSGIRRPGSAALDLAYVANGALDAFWEIGLSPWDIAAGGLLVQEAGGIISNLNGKQGWLTSGNVLASSPKIFDAMLETLAPHLTDDIKR